MPLGVTMFHPITINYLITATKNSVPDTGNFLISYWLGSPTDL